MTISLINSIRAGGYLQSEAEGTLSRGTVLLYGGFTGATTVKPGTLLGKLTANGKYVISPATGSDGSEIAVAIAFDWTSISEGDFKAAATMRFAEVRAADLTYDSTVNDDSKIQAKWDQLAAVGIIVRK